MGVVFSRLISGVCLGCIYVEAIETPLERSRLCRSICGKFKMILNRTDLDVFKNSGTPKSSILIGFSIKPSILGYPYFWKHPFVGSKIAGGFSPMSGSLLNPNPSESQP